MGSNTEVVLHLTFRPGTPDDVLAAFSVLADPPPVDSDPPAPPLPPPHLVDDETDLWQPTAEFGDPAQDPTPWLHDWSRWFSDSMSSGTIPGAYLVWSPLSSRWTLISRWNVKSWPEEILPALQWLGPHLDGASDQPTSLGHMVYGGDPRPVLLWLRDGRLEIEDVNGPDDRM